MKGHAKVMAHHERHENRPRRLGLLGDVTGRGDRYSRNTAPLNSALHERDRLMSYWSSRAEERRVGTIRDNRIRDLFCQGPFQSLRVHVVADEGDEMRRQAANHAFRRQLL